MTSGARARDDDLVAEPNESQSTSRTSGEPARAESAGEPEVVDAEVVEETTSGPQADQAQAGRASAGPRDDAEFRQYQQFLEFQKFQEWQRQQGGTGAPDGTGAPGGPTGTAPRSRKRRLWYYTRRALSFKPVRRLLYVVLLLLIILWAINHTFGSSENSSSNTGTPGNQDPGLSPALSSNPQMASVALYHYLASSSPETACHLISQPGQVAFAGAHGAPDCAAAAQRLHAQVTDPSSYGNPGFGQDAVQQVNDQAVVDSCKLNVQGGPRLGKIRLQRQYNGGWLIDRYAVPTC